MKTLSQVVAACAAVMAITLADVVRADPIADFYKGRTVTIIVSAGVGGAYGTYSRLLAQHMADHLPGRPTIIPQHMSGAGGTRAANYVSNVAARDGSVVAMLSEMTVPTQLLRPKAVKYDASKFVWVGAITPVTPVFMVHGDGPVKSIHDVMKRETLHGSTGKGSQTYVMPSMMNAFIGTRYKIIRGYDGSAGVGLAFKQREVESQSAAWSSWLTSSAEEIRTKAIVPIAQVGLKREKDLPDVPLILELAKSEEAKRVLRFISSSGAIGRSITTPPGVPTARLEALRTAFDATMADPAFLADAKKQRARLNPVPGADIQKVVEDMFATPAVLVEKARAAVK